MANQYALPEGAPPPPEAEDHNFKVIVVLNLILIFCLASIVINTSFGPGPGDVRREKVSRTQSDLRSLATALEAYHLDHGAYPLHTTNPSESANRHRPRGASKTRPTFRHALAPGQASITTPVAYIIGYFGDEFAPERGMTFCYYADGDGWILWSPGPDRDYDIFAPRDYDSSIPQPSPALLLVTYDPTNGTRSDGDVWRVKE